MHQTGKASCCCNLSQTQCDVVAELWLQLRTSLVFICENRTPLPKYKTSGHTLSSTPAVLCIQREPNLRNGNSPALCPSWLEAHLQAQPCPHAGNLCMLPGVPRCNTRVCAQTLALPGSRRSAPAPAHSLLRLGFALMAAPRHCLSAVSL